MSKYVFMPTGNRRRSQLLLITTVVQYLRPVSGFFWLKPVTLPGDYNLDIDEFVTAAQTYKPVTLASRAQCTEAHSGPALTGNFLRASFCSFGAEYSNNSWRVYSTTDPEKIDIYGDWRHRSLADREMNLPSMEEVSVRGDPMRYLAMGLGLPRLDIMRHEKIRWKIYRPIDTWKPNEVSRQLFVASGQDSTLGNLRKLEKGEKVVAKALPLENSGINKYIGEFLLTEVISNPTATYDDDVLRHGDFLVIQGGEKHIQGTFP
ncbi:hypothetical protein TWF730_002832 [Orbilia blumenaviensis]|uniref:Uncharacterized protein n=1 Tax=Orbilia blumenaviensis TaxID=1796055 RepID=A0AAV9U7H5_9PEZI